MSLDVHLRRHGRPSPGGSGIFVRQDGQTREIAREEWDRAFPGREPIVVPLDEDDGGEVFSANITHNLARMAEEAGIYLALWRPGEMLDPTIRAAIDAQWRADNFHGPGGVRDLERQLPIAHAHDLIEPLTAGLALMRAEPERFKALNPENGWGSYDGFVPWVERYLKACIANPDAEVSVSR